MPTLLPALESQLRELAATPYASLGEEELISLTKLPAKARIDIIHYALEQEPPNTELAAAVGILALRDTRQERHSFDWRENLDATEAAFPAFDASSMRADFGTPWGSDVYDE